MKNSIGKRLLSGILAIVLVLGYIPAPARAAQEDGLCPHHTQHTPECGYVPAVEGQPCGHEHTEDCAPDCVCTHESCGYVEASAEQPCNYVCQACAAETGSWAEPEEDEAATGSSSVVATAPPEEAGPEVAGPEVAGPDTPVEGPVTPVAPVPTEAPAPTEAPVPTETPAPTENPEQGNLVASGACGENLTWAYTDDGTLTISGTGAMDDYSDDYIENTDTFTTSAPWFGYPYRRLVLEEGITAIGSFAFACSGLAGEVEIPEGVVQIGYSAFMRTPELTGLRLPESLEFISSNMALESGLETVHIPAGVQQILPSAFSCSHLRQITVAQDSPYFLAENGLLYSADRTELLAIAGAAVTEIVIPDTVTTVQLDLFYSATELERLHIGSGITSFDWYENPFLNCKKLQQITVSPDNTVYTAQDGVLFDGTTLLCYPAAKTDASYAVPAGTRKLGPFSLSGNPFIQELILPDGMWAIQNGAGSDCVRLCAVTIPASVASIGAGSLGHNAGLVIRGYPDTAAEGYARENHCSFVSLEQSTEGADSGTCGEGLTWSVDGSTLTISGTGAMADYDFLTGETPNNAYCGANTPWHSRLITRIVVEEGVTGIGNRAFYALEKLESISLPGSLRRIGENAISNCFSLTQIDLPEGLEELGVSALFQCSGLSSLTLPASLKTIAEAALGGCQLSDIGVASGNTAFCVEDGVLYSADKTRLIAFTGDRTDLTIPDSVTVMDSCALEDGYSLRSITLGAGLTDLNGWLFQLSNLEQIQVSQTNAHLKTVDGVLFTMDGTELILYPNARGSAAYVVPNGTQTIRVHAFGNCPGLKSLILPQGLRTMDFNCIWCAELREVIIPASVETMEYACVGYAYGEPLEGFTISGYSGTVAETYAAENGFTFVPLTAEELTLTFDVQGGIGGPEAMTVPAGQILSLPEAAPTRAGYRFCGWTLKQGSMVASYQPGDSIVRYADTTLYAVWLPESAASSGKCGDNLVWTLSNDGTLTISGTGRMYDYYYQPDGNGNYLPSTPMPALNATRLVIEEGVTYIGYSAFRDCVTLTGDLIIPETVTAIASSAFENCPGFNGRLVLPEKLTSLGAWAFMNCGFTGDLVIPEGVMTIGNSTFNGCGFGGKLVIPDTVRYIEGYAFSECSGLTGGLTLPEGLKRIGESAFSGCSGFTGGLILPDSLTSLGAYAFGRCSGFTGSLTLPGSLVYITDNAFAWCDHLSSVTIQEGTQAIGDQTFAYCHGIRNLMLPVSLIDVGHAAFGGFYPSTPLVCSYNGTTEQWQKVTIGRNNQALTEATMICHAPSLPGTISGTCGENLTWKLTNDGTLTISGSGVMVTGEYGARPWEAHLQEIKKVILGNGVESIADRAFYECTSLTSVTIPDSVTAIGAWSFYYCASLTSVTIPDSVTTIADGVFSWCTSLTSATLPKEITAIGYNAFYNCTDLTSITIPDSVTAIGYNAFYNCTDLTSVTIPDSVTAIGEFAFDGCTSLTSVTIPDSVTTIGERAFSRCTSLASVTIPDSVTAIEAGTFCGCTSLTSVTIPDSVTTIGDYAFTDCTGLTSVTIPDSVTAIGEWAFDGCTGLATVHIPSTVSQIASDSFGGCTGLKDIYFNGSRVRWNKISTNVDLPSDVVVHCTHIADGTCGVNLTWKLTNDGTLTISGTGDMVMDEYWAGPWKAHVQEIKKVILENGVTYIAAHAFEDCINLTSIAIPDSVTAIGSHAFDYCTSLTSIAIPDSVTAIASDAFRICRSLTEVTIPDSVTTIGSYAFELCTSLTSVTIPSSITTIERATFRDCAGLTELVIPDSVESIEDEAFARCSGLTSLKFGKNLIFIDMYAFSGCTNLKGELVIPENVTKIGANVLNETSIQTLLFRGTTAPANLSSGLDGMDHLNAIYVPLEALSAYQESCGALSGKVLPYDTLPAKITIADLTPESVTLQWAPVAGALSYQVVIDDSLTYTTTETTFRDVLKPGQQRTYTVSAKLPCGLVGEEATIDVAAPLPEILSITTDNGNVITTHHNTLYAKIDGTSEGLTGTFYYSKDRQNVTIASGLTGTDQNGIGVFTADWDNQALPEGEYSVTFVLNSSFGGTQMLDQTITVDHSVPARIVGLRADGDVRNVTLSWGIAEELATNVYRVYRKTAGETEYTLLREITGRNNHSYVDTACEIGTEYDYYVVGVNQYGEESEPSEIVRGSRLPDTEAPRILRLIPANGASVHGMVTVIAEAEDNVDVTELWLLISRDGGSTWTELAQCTSGKLNTQLDTTAYPDGELRLKAIARDAEGNESDPMLCTVTVDNTGPEQVTGLRYEATSVTVTLHWNDVSDEDVAHFLVERAESDGSFTSIARVKALGIHITSLTPGGAYAYRVTACDRLGNMGTPSQVIAVSTQADTTEPVITKLSPAPGYYSKSIPMSVSAEDDYNIAGVRVEVSTNLINWTEVDSREFTDLSARRQVSFTLKLDDFEEGSLFVRAVAWDSGDHESNTGVDAPYVQYIVDRTPPAAPEITAEGHAGYAEIRWAKGTEADLNRYTVYRSETENGTFTVTASGLNTLNYFDRNVADNGVYFYKVAVSDRAGNVSELSATAGVQIDPDTIAPEIVSIYPADGSVLNTASAQISVLARDNSKLDRIVAEYSLDGSVFTELGRVEDIGTSSQTGQWKLPSEILRDDAQITVRAYAVDGAGLESDYVTADYTVDNQAPSVGTATAVYDDNAVVVRWKSRMEQDLLGYQVYRVAGSGNRTLVGGRQAVANQLDYALTDTTIPLAKGSYTYYIEALDTCGNAGGVTTNSVELPDRSYPKPVLHFDYTMEANVEYLFDATDSTDNGRIVSYLLDFGDGTTSSEAKSVHRYQSVGTYTVVLTVTDDDGNVSTLTDTVTVKERTEIGKVEITVVDQNGVPVPNAQVYFDLGETTQTIRKTDGQGVVSFTANAGKHNVGCFIADNNWLPVKKAVVARAGATERLKMIMVRQTMIEGNFEIDRMTFEEIVAAGIDISAPENQHIMHFNVQLTYGEYQPVESSFNFNPNTHKIIGAKPVIVETPDGERRKVTPIGIIGSGGGGSGGNGGTGGGGTAVENTAVVMLDIPAEASFLKEFFDVKLHIINNAGSEFSMRDNFITLNVPAGLSIVDTVATEGNAVVYVPTIAGQTTCTIPWILRGDEQGDYLLDADYSGILSQFNETVLTTFRADDPIHVYGKQAVKLLVEANSSSMYGAYYFNLGIMNDSPIEVNMPSVDVIGNVISAYLQGSEAQERHPDVHVLGVEVRNQSGVIQKLAADTQVNTLAPGETLVKCYAVYNAVDYHDYLVLKDASIQTAEDCGVEIIFKEVGMDLFDLEDAMDKLGEIRSDPSKQSMYQRIMNHDNYMYVWEATDRDKHLMGYLADKAYATGKLLFEGKFFYNNEQNKKFTRQLVCTLLQDEAMEQIIADRVDTEALDIVVKMLNAASDALTVPDEPMDDLQLELAKRLTELSGDADAVRSLADALAKGEGTTFEDRLVNYVVSYAEAGVGEALRAYLVDTDFVAEVMMDVYSDVFKCFGDAAGLVAEGIKSWNDAAQYAAELANIAAAQEESIALLDMLVENCEDGTPMRKELESIRKDIEDTVAAQRREFFQKVLELGGAKIATESIKKAIEWAFGAKGKAVLFIVKCTFKSLDSKFDWQEGSDDKHALRVCMQMSEVLGRAAIRYPLTTESETEAIYIMRALKYLVKMRLVGEQTYVDQMKDQNADKQETSLKEMNSWLSSNYSSFDAYMTYLYETLPAYRDSLFRKAPAQDILRPAAPQVTLDFLAHATVESFDSRYEYSYNGEAWAVCDGGPIQVEPKRVGGSLWVRVRQTDESLTGNIAKLAVPAQPRILGDLTATHDGSYYVVTGLNAGIYRVGFKRAEAPAEQFQTVQVSGSGILTVSKAEKFTQLTIQSPASANSFESLVREVPVEDIALPDNACGDDLIWLMDSRGVLTISGTGAMWDYASVSAAPWYGEKITGLVLEEGITRIGSNAFAGLNLKGALKLPETLREIGSGAFDGCTGLTGSLTIPSGVTEIGARAFYGCTGLSGTVHIPAAAQALGVNAFGSCTRLTAFAVDAGNPTMTAVEGVLYSADGSILLACPAGKRNMTAIPERTETIGASAFSGCVNVKKLTIPTSLTSIERDAFIGCTNLRDVYYQGTMDAWRQIYGWDYLSGVKMHVSYQIFYGNLPETCSNPNPAYGSSDTLLYLKNPTAVGYTFGGWYLDAELTQKVTRIASGRTEALTLYAKMTPNAYSVRYNGNGANGGTMSVTKAVYDEPFQLALNAFVRKGYTFDGWMRSMYGQEAEFTDGQDITQNLTTVKGATVNLYAHWSPNPYEVHFDSNGGEGEMAAQEFVYGQSQKLTLSAFTRRGYSFTGWNTQPDGKGTGYGNTASVKNLADGETVTEVTLYAMWRANTYTVTFHANGGSGRDTKQTLTYDKPANLMKPSFNRTGCAIDGWMRTPAGEDMAYEPLEEVVNLADGEKVRNVDLYAHWRPNRYTIAFQANGGVGETPSMERIYNDYLDESVDTCLPGNGFTRVGYDFAGWATSSRGKVAYTDGAQVDKNLSTADGATVNLYAVWTPHVYTVVFDPGCDNATGTMKNLTNRKYDTGFALTSNAFKRTGYTFVGWSLKPDADVEFTNRQSVLNLTSEQNGIVTLYAVWKASDYTITYKNITAAELEAFGLTRNYSVEQQVFLPGSEVVRRDGYTFGGWYTDSKYRNPVSGIALGSTGNRTLYAKWTANQYTVVFDSGALDVGSAEMLYTYGKSFKLPDVTSALKFTKPGYQFVGWQMEDGTLLKNKQSVKNLALEGEVTLTAQWQRIVYKITYKNVTAMEAGECPATYTVEDGVRLPWLEADTRPGCTFEGWFTDAYYRKPFEDFDAGRTGNLTIYAKWSGTAKTYQIVFDKNDTSATGSMRAMTNLIPGREYTLTANAFSLRGYTFAGWEAENARTNTLTNRQKFSSLAQEDASVVTLKAQWVPTEYKITYKNILATDDNEGNPTTYTVASDEVFLNEPIRQGYTFGGWYTDTSLRKPFESIPQGEIGNRTVYAKWIANSYTVIFSSGDGEGEPAEQTRTYKYNTTYTLPDVTKNLKFTKPGYQFTGWLATVSGEPTVLANKARIKNLSTDGEVELVAQWEPIAYRITYKNVTAMEVTAAENPTVYTVDDQFELRDPVRPGCTFEGWFLDSSCRKPAPGIEDGTTGNKTFYAKWTGKASTYSIHYEGNGATSGVMRDQTGMVCGKEYALTANTFKRTGYTFLGWSTDELSEVPDLLNRQKVSTLIGEGDTSVTLYAVWAPTEYTIRYRNVNAEEAEINSGAYTVENPVQFNAPQREDYTFLGWYIDGKPVEGTKDRSGNLIVYARWEKAE